MRIVKLSQRIQTEPAGEPVKKKSGKLRTVSGYGAGDCRPGKDRRRQSAL